MHRTLHGQGPDDVFVTLTYFVMASSLLHRFTINFFIGISARVGKEICFPENEFEEGLTA